MNNDEAQRRIEAFIYARDPAAIERLTPEDFRAAARRMKDVTLRLTKADVVRLLEGYLQGDWRENDLRHWCIVVYHGVHPEVMHTLETKSEGSRLREVAIVGDDAKDHIYTEYDERDHDAIADVISDLEDLGDEYDHLDAPRVRRWLRELKGTEDA